MKIGIGGDHAGFDYKREIIQQLTALGHTVTDFGPHSNESCDYPDQVHPLAKSIVAGENEMGVIICGSGNGVNMVANKYQEIRSGLCWTVELAELTRLHNNANVLAVPARFIDLDTAKAMVEKFFSTKFEGGRHNKRVDKISC